MTWYANLSMILEAACLSGSSVVHHIYIRSVCREGCCVVTGHTGYSVVQVGGFCIMMKEDMKRVAPLWLKFSKKVRHDPDVCTSTA